ncbi:hypothetical protein DFQ26_000951, partial [Actinomortierella ambigua]
RFHSGGLERYNRSRVCDGRLCPRYNLQQCHEVHCLPLLPCRQFRGRILTECRPSC